MKAAITPSYGPADILETRDVPMPKVGDHDVLVQVHATPVTAGDVRMRAGDFPSITKVPGRLIMGVFRPKHPVQGTMFAGRIVEVGAAVERYAIGDDVFGFTGHGAYAEYLAMPEDGAMAKMPSNTSYEEAAAVPYGAGTARYFLRDLGAVKRGDKVLIVGASGGVGRFAVQLAKHFGAEVTAVCSRRSFDVVRSLGADHLIDHASEDFTQNGQIYDVIFDVAGVSSFGRARRSLTHDGRFLTLLISVCVLLQMLVTRLFGSRRVMFGIALDDRKRMEELRELMEQGVVRPVIAERFPLERIADAHAAVATQRSHGSVLITRIADTPGSDPQTTALGEQFRLVPTLGYTATHGPKACTTPSA